MQPLAGFGIYRPLVRDKLWRRRALAVAERAVCQISPSFSPADLVDIGAALKASHEELPLAPLPSISLQVLLRLCRALVDMRGDAAFFERITELHAEKTRRCIARDLSVIFVHQPAHHG